MARCVPRAAAKVSEAPSTIICLHKENLAEGQCKRQQPCKSVGFHFLGVGVVEWVKFMVIPSIQPILNGLGIYHLKVRQIWINPYYHHKIWIIPDIH